MARLVLADLFRRVTRGRVSAFCAVWLLPACVPASVGLSIPGLGAVLQKPSSLCIAGPQNFPPQADGTIHGEVGSHPLPAQSGLGALCIMLGLNSHHSPLYRKEN